MAYFSIEKYKIARQKAYTKLMQTISEKQQESTLMVDTFYARLLTLATF